MNAFLSQVEALLQAGLGLVTPAAESVRANPLAYAVAYVVVAVILNLVLGAWLAKLTPADPANPKAGSAFDKDKLGHFLEAQFATARMGILAASLFSALVAPDPITQGALTALFVTGALAQGSAIAADNGQKLKAIGAAYLTRFRGTAKVTP